jgi:hypothetical protein
MGTIVLLSETKINAARLRALRTAAGFPRRYMTPEGKALAKQGVLYANPQIGTRYTRASSCRVLRAQ